MERHVATLAELSLIDAAVLADAALKAASGAAAPDAAEPPSLVDLLAALPLGLVHYVFARVPVDARLRCCEVSPAWRGVLSDRHLWRRLDFSEASGGLVAPFSHAMLRAAVVKAQGLVALNLGGRGESVLPHPALLAVVAANGATLRELRIPAEGRRDLSVAKATELVRSAQFLRTFVAEIDCNVLGQRNVATATAMLKKEPPWQALQLVSLDVTSFQADWGADFGAPLFKALGAHPPLKGLKLSGAPLGSAAAAGRMAAAAVRGRLPALLLAHCDLMPPSVPALAHVFSGGSLAMFYIANGGVPLLDERSAPLLAASLRGRTSLRAVVFQSVGLWHAPALGAALLQAVRTSTTIESLGLRDNPVPREAGAYAGAAMAALLAGPAGCPPLLKTFTLDGCRLGDAGLALLFDSLPTNPVLETLDVCENGLTAGCARSRLLPAVRAAPGLRTLRLRAAEEPDETPLGVALAEAEALVAARGGGRGPAARV